MNNVRFLQEQRGMTQDEFAEYCDLPRISIARYSTGAPISRKNAEKIAAACNSEGHAFESHRAYQEKP